MSSAHAATIMFCAARPHRTRCAYRRPSARRRRAAAPPGSTPRSRRTSRSLPSARGSSMMTNRHGCTFFELPAMRPACTMRRTTSSDIGCSVNDARVPLRDDRLVGIHVLSRLQSRRVCRRAAACRHRHRWIAAARVGDHSGHGTIRLHVPLRRTAAARAQGRAAGGRAPRLHRRLVVRDRRRRLLHAARHWPPPGPRSCSSAPRSPTSTRGRRSRSRSRRTRSPRPRPAASRSASAPARR